MGDDGQRGLTHRSTPPGRTDADEYTYCWGLGGSSTIRSVAVCQIVLYTDRQAPHDRRTWRRQPVEEHEPFFPPCVAGTERRSIGALHIPCTCCSAEPRCSAVIVAEHFVCIFPGQELFGQVGRAGSHSSASRSSWVRFPVVSTPKSLVARAEIELADTVTRVREAYAIVEPYDRRLYEHRVVVA